MAEIQKNNDKKQGDPQVGQKEGSVGIEKTKITKKRKQESLDNRQVDVRHIAREKYKEYINNDEQQAVDFEKGIYNKSINYCIQNKYARSLQDKTFNSVFLHYFAKCLMILDKNNNIHNSQLRQNIDRKEIEPHTIAFCKDKQLRPQIWEPVINLKKQNIDKIVQSQDYKPKEGLSTIYKCKNCKCNLTYVETMQMKSGDEGSTTKITCSQCGTVWKQY